MTSSLPQGQNPIHLLHGMNAPVITIFFAVATGVASLPAVDAPEKETPKELRDELQAESDHHMRDELGVNDITTPSIASLLKDFSTFQPIPFAIIDANPRDATYGNRLQTALHFGSLVADGFMLTVAERPQDIQDVGRALIRQSRALGVGDRLTKRSKSLFEASDQRNWAAMREELIRTQSDVEESMIDLHDEEMAHMISLGGWMRGFQLAANSCADKYSADRARILGHPEVLEYYLDRLSTLHPRLLKTQFVLALTAQLNALLAVITAIPDRSPNLEEVEHMRSLSNEIEVLAMGPVDSDGNISSSPSPM
jgi:hypothetical protein